MEKTVGCQNGKGLTHQTGHIHPEISKQVPLVIYAVTLEELKVCELQGHLVLLSWALKCVCPSQSCENCCNKVAKFLSIIPWLESSPTTNPDMWWKKKANQQSSQNQHHTGH